MKRGGVARRKLIISMCPPGRPVIDVGADHGHVAAALGGIATERHPRRVGRRDVPWVIADGLRPFRTVAVAIISGMGAQTIARILTAGPRPDQAVLHAQDDPIRLRQWLADNDWRIDAEGLAPEAGRYAEVVRVSQGVESATGHRLKFGPRLLEGNSPFLRAHLSHQRTHWNGLAQVPAPDVASRAKAWVNFLDEVLQSRGWT